MDFKVVVSDADGVLFDSYREGLRRIRYLCSMHEIPFDRHTRLRLTELWGAPGVELLQKGLGLKSKAFAEELYQGWERIDQNEPPPLVPGAREAFIWLRQNGFKSALLTSRNRENTRIVLDRHDLTHEFAFIATREDVRYRKPDKRALRPILQFFEDEHGITPAECIFVGDTLTDVQCGVNAGVTTLVVQTGPYLIRHMKNAGELPIPFGNILGSLDDLPGWVEENYDGTLTRLSM